MAKKRELKYSSPKKSAEKHTSGFTPTSVRTPEGMKRWKIEKEGTYRIDILPYIVGKGNAKAEEGSAHYERTYQVHARIGKDENSYACPRRCFGKPCSICEQKVVLGKDPEALDDEIKALIPKDRQLFIVVDHADRETGPQLWENSYHLFGKLLEAKLKNADDDEYENFHSLTDGMSLRITAVEKTMGKGGKPFYEVVDIEFKPRKTQYDEDMIDDLPCLDDCIIDMKYDELRKIFLQIADDEDEKPSKKKPAVDDDEDEPAPKKKPKPADDEDDEPAPKPKKKPVDDDDDEPAPKPKKKPAVDEDDDEPAPPKKKPKVDDDEDEPAPKKPSGKGKTAADLGIEIGSKVTHEDHGKCEVVHISADGMACRIKDSDGDTQYAIKPHELTLVSGKKAKPVDDEDEPAPKKKPKPADDDEAFDDDPPPKKKKPAVDDDEDEPAPPKKKKPAVDDDD